MTDVSEEDIGLMRRQGDLADFIRAEVTRARNDCARRRAQVLAHPDLADRLTIAPLNYATAQAWTGYLPPERWNGRHNNSPTRTALVALISEAAQRAHTRYGAAA
ncbi:hypothetical protein [Streptomyces indicus]|uniref:Uncharacterized protein n=1 Tax=Streptomyces indicus TaxID=417292 RepID=A0A1G8W9F2_9ACTN|nr:hypothetical protein [Streptomyces indicus]SDJ74766.1 hypothetical protein SAMN05421806_102313 [Streptomyces indicus]